MSKPFPVLWSYTTPERERTPKFIRWDALNEEWAGRNHGQTLARLAERGGLSPCEIVANIERRPWHSIALSAAREAIAPYAVPTDETSAALKVGDRVRVTIGVHNAIPSDGWVIAELPGQFRRAYRLTHADGGDMTIDPEYVVAESESEVRHE